MNGTFRVVTTPSFEREFRKISQRNAKLVGALEELIAILAQDPMVAPGSIRSKNWKV